MQRVEAEIIVSVSDLKKNPCGNAIAILNHNRVMAYLVPTGTFEALTDVLDGQALVEIAKARAGEKGVPVSLDGL